MRETVSFIRESLVPVGPKGVYTAKMGLPVRANERI